MQVFNNFSSFILPVGSSNLLCAHICKCKFIIAEQSNFCIYVSSYFPHSILSSTILQNITSPPKQIKRILFTPNEILFNKKQIKLQIYRVCVVEITNIFFFNQKIMKQIHSSLSQRFVLIQFVGQHNTVARSPLVDDEKVKK